MGGKRLNREIINSRLKERGIVMLTDYERQYIPAEFQCHKGHRWMARPGNILSGKGCPTCGRESARKKMILPDETVRQRLADKGISLIGPYTNTTTRTIFSCERGHTWVTTPNAVMSRTGCPECAGNNLPLSKCIINDRIKDRGIKLVGEYFGAHVSTLFECSEGHNWLARPANIMHLGRNCPHCARQFPLSKEIVNERIADKGIEMLGEYVNNSTNALFKCNEGHTWEAMPANVVKNNGTGCPFCAGNLPLSKDIVNERIADRNVTMIGEYVNNSTRSIFICNEGHTWETPPASVLSGTGCPICAERYTDNDVFYIWVAGPQNHVHLDDGEYLIKYGVSSERRGNLRMREIGYAWGTTANVVAIVKTKNNALNIEKQVEAIGRPISNNLSYLEGYTEFRVVNESELAQFFLIAEESAEYKIVWRNLVKGIRPSGFDQLRLEL